MGLYYQFFVQQRERTGWIVPDGFTNRFDGFREELGHFVWFKHAPLFVGEKAIFRLETNPPPGIEHTVLFQRLDYGFDEWYRGWIAFEDILLDEWSDSYLFIPAHVPRPLARLFGDGAQPFPEQDLLDRGCAPDDVAEFRDDSHTVMLDGPIVPGSGADGSRGWVNVSWTMSIADFIEDWRVSEFHKLRQYGSDSELRIVCTYS